MSAVWMCPKLQSSMYSLVTSNFNHDSIKNEQASIETRLSNYKSGIPFQPDSSSELKICTRLFDVWHVIETYNSDKKVVVG